MRRFAENLTFDNLFQLTYEDLVQGFDLKGRWHENFLKTRMTLFWSLAAEKGNTPSALPKGIPTRISSVWISKALACTSA